FDGADSRNDESRHNAKQARLSRSGRSQDHEHLAMRDVERHCVQDGRVADRDVDRFESDRGTHVWLLPRRKWPARATTAAVMSTCTTARAATTGSGPFASRVKMRTGSGSPPGG